MSKNLTFLISVALLLGIALSSTASAVTGLIGWWRFDEGGGTIAYDSSGLGNDGILGSEGNPQWVAGRFGGAIQLDGSDDYINIDAVADDMPADNNITISAWIMTTANDEGTVIGGNESGGGHDVIFGVSSSGQLLIEADSARTYGSGLNDGQWHMITYVRNGTTAYLYIDGVQVGTETPGGDPHREVQWSIGQEWDPPSPSDEYTGAVDDVRFYNRPLTVEEIQTIMKGASQLAEAVSPQDGATDVPRDASLNWVAGEFAGTHDVYFGAGFDDVNEAGRGDQRAVLASQGQTETSFTPAGLLEYGQTYYWRIDEVNATPDNTIFQGETWSFTVEPYGYPIANVTATASSAQPDMGPEKTVDGSGLNAQDQHSTELTDMWTSEGSQPNWIQFEFDKVYKLHELLVWNSNQLIEGILGFGAKDVTIEYSVDGATWTALEGVPPFAQATASANYAANTTVDLGGVLAQFVKLTINSNWGGMAPQTGLAEVRFLYVPVRAFEPAPAVAATDVSIDAELTWRPGREAESHEVYLGTDPAALTLADTVTDASYSPATLGLGTTYYWKVNEIGGGGPYDGEVWSFTTSDNFLVEDFESYTDEPGEEIYDSAAGWADGYDDPANGSQVGHLTSPFAERKIVHGGKQAMPLSYSNTNGVSFSEGTRTFDSPQDWTRAGFSTLTLWFQGALGNTGQLYVKINGTKVAYSGAAGTLALAGWQPWNIDLTAVSTNLKSVKSLAVGVEGNGAAGTLYFDDIALYATGPAPITEWRVSASTDDREEYANGGAMDSATSTDLELGYEGAASATTAQIVGCRWVSIPVPAGATITEAWVQFSADSVSSAYHQLPVSLIIEGELNPNPVTFGGTGGEISSRPKTIAKVVWDIPVWTQTHLMGPGERTPDISSIIQEIVNQPGWAGEAIVLSFRDNPAKPSEGCREAEAFDGEFDEAPLLHISYQ